MKSNRSPKFLRWVLALTCLAGQAPFAWTQPPQNLSPSADPAQVADGKMTHEASAPQKLRDVRLQDSGRLAVRVLNATGQPEPDQIVRILYQNSVIAETLTDANGQVTVTGLRPGIHVVASGNTLIGYRLWTAQTAPPAAINAPALVLTDPSIRGQYGYGYGPGAVMAPGLLATGVTAVAVAAVLAGKNSGDGSVVVTPSSP